MARAFVEPSAPIEPPVPEPLAAVARPPQALQVTDGAGRRALAWRRHGRWQIDTGDPGLRRRLRRALATPLWVREDVAGPDGVPSSTVVQIPPDDPRYANRLIWQWHQLGLDDVAVDVVPLEPALAARKPAGPPSRAADSP
jgi:hypothetical protein